MLLTEHFDFEFFTWLFFSASFQFRKKKYQKNETIVVTSVVCPIPDSPKNGKAIYTSLSYNSIVSYECRYGYTLVNDSSRRCGADRKWSGTLPTCKGKKNWNHSFLVDDITHLHENIIINLKYLHSIEINCGSPGILYNGWTDNMDAGTGLGASIIFRCQPGMLLVGNSSTVCQIDGRWRYPVPECLGMIFILLSENVFRFINDMILRGNLQPHALFQPLLKAPLLQWKRKSIRMQQHR